MKTVIEMAREAGIDDWWDSGSEQRETFNMHLERLIALARADEREGCAKLCEEDGLLWGQRYAAAIRARGNT